MTKTGGECGQNGGDQTQNAFHLPMPGSGTKCSGADAGKWLAQQAYPVPPAKHENRCGIVSTAVARLLAWRWALEAQSTAQFATDWGAETMQNMCRALPSWRELFLGILVHADHPKPCRADSPCLPYFAWGLICCRLSRAAICACLATGVCVGSVTLELWVMRGTCSWSALLLQISETSTLHWLQSAQVSWLGLCGPETSPWSAGTSLLASIECHADDRQTLFHPFSLVGCQGCCKLSFLPSSMFA